MKAFAFLILFSFSLNSIAANLSVLATYNCDGGSQPAFVLQVTGRNSIMLNNKESGTVVKEAADNNPFRKILKIKGNFPETLGDGAEGYQVDVSVSKSLFFFYKVAYLNTTNRGPDGFYSESYKCVRQN